MANKKAVELLFNLGRVWDPIFWIYEGTEEQEEPVFDACVYSLELRERLWEMRLGLTSSWLNGS